MSIYQLKITLRDIRPAIWRRLLVPGDFTLGLLHDLIQDAFGWEGCHLHSFEVGGVEYGQSDPDDYVPLKPENRHRLRSLVGAKDRFVYTYDFGDDWRHEILVEKVLEPEAGVAYPVCIAGARACPPEDCGGPGGYQDLVAVLADPDDERHEEMLDWIGGPLSPEELDLDLVNRTLARHHPRRASGRARARGASATPAR